MSFLFLDPFSPERLVQVCGVTSAMAFVLAVVAIWGVEKKINDASADAARDEPEVAEAPKFLEVLREVWSETRARRFTVFVFISMLAYSAQDLILEPFAGIAFGMTPGESTQLAGVQHGGVLLGMFLFAAAARLLHGRSYGSLQVLTTAGCIASALTMLVLSMAGMSGPPWPLHASVFALGVANGAFAVSAIGMMMALAGQGRGGREGTRMGLWGAAQGIAFGLGGSLGAFGVDLARILLGSPVTAYVVVFALQALLFVYAAWLMITIERPERRPERAQARLASGDRTAYIPETSER